MKLGWWCLGLIMALSCVARAQQPAADPSAIARSLANPLARITTLSTEIRLAAGMGEGRNGLVNEITLVKPFELPNSWAVITRGTLPISLMQDSRNYVGLGDLGLGAYVVTPPRGALYAGAGVVASLPSANRRGLGSRNWEFGPSAAVGDQSDVITAGVLGSQRWTLGGPDAGPRTTLTVLQGQFSFGLGDGWSTGLSTETHYDWEAAGRQRWTVPITFTLGRVFTFNNDRAVQLGGLVTHYAMPGGAQQAVWEVGLNLAVVIPNGYFFR
jgi:hypothetical protein